MVRSAARSLRFAGHRLWRQLRFARSITGSPFLNAFLDEFQFRSRREEQRRRPGRRAPEHAQGGDHAEDHEERASFEMARLEVDPDIRFRRDEDRIVDVGEALVEGLLAAEGKCLSRRLCEPVSPTTSTVPSTGSPATSGLAANRTCCGMLSEKMWRIFVRSPALATICFIARISRQTQRLDCPAARPSGFRP